MRNIETRLKRLEAEAPDKNFRVFQSILKDGKETWISGSPKEVAECDRLGVSYRHWRFIPTKSTRRHEEDV